MFWEIALYLLLNVTFALTPGQSGLGTNADPLTVKTAVAGATPVVTGEEYKPGRPVVINRICTTPYCRK